MNAHNEKKMNPQLVEIGLELLKTLMRGGNDSGSIRTLIQEELRKSHSQENREMMQQMLSALEQKYAEDLQTVNLEKEKYKLEAEFLRKELQDAKKEKKSAERTDKLKEILNHLSELSLQKDQTSSKHQTPSKDPLKNQKQNNYSGNKLPWMDCSKGNHQSTSRGGGHRGNGNYHNNFTSRPKSQLNQNFQKNTNLQQMQSQPSFLPNPNLQHMQFQSHLLPNPDLQHMQFQQTMSPNTYFQQPQAFVPNQNLPLNPNFHVNQNMQKNVSPNAYVQPNPTFQQQHNFGQNNNVPNIAAFKQDTYFHQRDQNRYRGRGRGRGRGQRGNSGRGGGRSSSVGRDQALMNQISDDTVPSASFHIQVSKVSSKWVSSETISLSTDASSQRGRGRGRGRGNSHGGGKGRGAVNNQQEFNGAQAGVKKNRRKNQQTEHQTEGNQKQHVPRNKQKNNEEDPEDNCIVS